MEEPADFFQVFKWDNVTPSLTASIAGPDWKQGKCLSTSEWVNSYIPTVELFRQKQTTDSHNGRDEAERHDAEWKKQETKGDMIPFIWDFGKTIGAKVRSVVASGGEHKRTF